MTKTPLLVPLPTAAPPDLILSPPAELALASTTGAAATVGAVIGAPLVALDVAAAQALLDLAACRGPGSELPFPQALIPGARIGADAGSIERAAVLFNELLTLVAAAAMFGVGALLVRVRAGNLKIATTIGAPDVESIWLRAVAAVQMPGTVVLFQSLCMQGTMTASVRLARSTQSPAGDAVLIVFGLAVIAAVMGVGFRCLCHALRVGGPLRYAAASVSIDRPRGTCAERAARSELAAVCFFGRAMWRPSRVVGAATDVFDPAAARVAPLFISMRPPRRDERFGALAPRYYFVPLTGSLALGLIQGFADYCDAAAWAATVLAAVLLAGALVVRPAIVPLANAKTIAAAAMTFLSSLLLALRSALASETHEVLTDGASACAVILMGLGIGAFVRSLLRRGVLLAAGARLSENNFVDADVSDDLLTVLSIADGPDGLSNGDAARRVALPRKDGETLRLFEAMNLDNPDVEMALLLLGDGRTAAAGEILSDSNPSEDKPNAAADGNDMSSCLNELLSVAAPVNPSAPAPPPPPAETPPHAQNTQERKVQERKTRSQSVNIDALRSLLGIGDNRQRQHPAAPARTANEAEQALAQAQRPPRRVGSTIGDLNANGTLEAAIFMLGDL
jgi:hypothetical protein